MYSNFTLIDLFHFYRNCLCSYYVGFKGLYINGRHRGIMGWRMRIIGRVCHCQCGMLGVTRKNSARRRGQAGERGETRSGRPRAHPAATTTKPRTFVVYAGLLAIWRITEAD